MIWNDKPSMPMDKVWHLEDQYSGEDAQSKFERLATELKDNDFLVVTTLDDIAWLLNLRGDDISFNPLFFSYLVFDVKNKSATLCIKHEKIADIAQYLQDIKVSVEDYTDLPKVLGALPANSSVAVDESAISIDYKNMTEGLGHKVVKLGKNVIQHMKASKNPVQQEGMRQANIRDCSAIMKYMAYLEEELKKPDHTVDEYTGAERLLEYRKQNDKFL